MEKKIIKNTGSYFTPDKNGFLINPCSINLIQPEFKDALELSVEHAKKHLGDNLHSIYLRGSIAKGTAVKNISDIDLYIVTEDNETETRWKETSEKEICNRYTFIRGIEFHLETTENVLSRKGEQFLLQTQSVKIFGKDLNLPQFSYKIGKESYAHIFFIEKDIKDFYKYISEEPDEDIPDVCSWIAKRIVRTGFELVMKRENLYTRDLYPCYKSFIKYYPERENQMYDLLELAVNPVNDKKVIISTVKEIEQFIITESTETIALLKLQ